MLLQKFLSRKKLSRKYRTIFGLKNQSCDRRYSPVMLLLSLISPALSFDNEGDSLCVMGAICELVMSIIVSRRSDCDVDLSSISPLTKGHAILAVTCDTGPFFM